MGGSRLHKFASPFNAAELSEIDFEQSFDALYFAHLNHEPPRLIREGHTSWTFATVTFGAVIAAPGGVAVVATVANTDADNGGNAYFPRAQRYVVASVDDDAGQVSLASAEVACTNDLTLKRNSNTVTWAAEAAADRYFIYKANNDGGFGYIGETTGLTFLDDNILADLTDGPRVGRNPFAEAGDYPSTVFFFEQRLGYARTANNPNAMYLSRSADLENMDVSRPVVEDDAISIRLVATKVNSVNQVVPLDELIALTSNGIFAIVGSNEDYLAASPPPRQRRKSGRGASRLDPIVVDNVVFYTPAMGGAVRALNYAFDVAGYKSDNMSIFSPHFFEGKQIVDWAYAEEPYSIVVAILDDGDALCFTWEREQEVWGWTRWQTQGKYLNVCVIPEVEPSTGVAEHRIYLVVERVIDGVRRRFVERVASGKWEDQVDGLFLDCAQTFRFEEPQTDIFVPHLMGAEVSILADGFVYLSKVVGDDGYLTLSSPASTVHVGLPYTSLIETLPLVIPSPNGGYNAGKVQQLGNCLLRMVKTRGIRAGRKPDDLLGLKTRTNEPLGSPTALLTGDYLVQTAALASFEATIFVEQHNPLPMTITAIFLDPVAHE